MKDDLFGRRDASLPEVAETAERCLCTNAAEQSSVHGGGFGSVSCVGALQNTCTLSRRKRRYYNRVKARLQHKLERADAVGGLFDIFTFDKMYKYGKKCCNGVRWKNSIQRFEDRLFSGTASRIRDILAGRYKWKKCNSFVLIERGKTRNIDAPHVHDRQIHKVLTKEVLLPLYTPLLIWNNGASMEGKGLEFSRKELLKDMRYHYRKYGMTGHVIITDCKGFFPNAEHDVIVEHHKKIAVDSKVAAILDSIVYALRRTKGVPLGIEPSQLEMICYPSKLDNFMKCQLGLKGAGHYMDDYYMLVPPSMDLREVLSKFLSKAAENKIIISPNKTKIIPFGKPFRFCKAKYCITQTGKIYVHGSRHAAIRCRRKLRMMKKKNVSKIELWATFQSTLNYYKKTNDRGRVDSLLKYFYSLFHFQGNIFRKFKNYEIYNAPQVRQGHNEWSASYDRERCCIR